jgi:cytochrome o ubiquinol oxidase subunit 2
MRHIKAIIYVHAYVIISRRQLMKKTIIALGAGIVVFVSALALIVHSHAVPVWNPAGVIASKEKNLILITAGLGLLVVLPVITMLFVIAWKYRATNTASDYQPEWDHSRRLETLWWGIPCVIILVLAVITWQSTHELDPFKPLASTTQPIKIQVVALQWRWLFIYPDQGVASINMLPLPEKTPINFQITADAPMNSFWIPSLGGQIYAMSGMSTQLHLMANTTGSYHGSSANISGRGFSSMQFMAHSMTRRDFDAWVLTARLKSRPLDIAQYNSLALPSTDASSTSFSLMRTDLYDKILMKYMPPEVTSGHSSHMIGENN